MMVRPYLIKEQMLFPMPMHLSRKRSSSLIGLVICLLKSRNERLNTFSVVILAISSSFIYSKTGFSPNFLSSELVRISDFLGLVLTPFGEGDFAH